MLFPTGVFALFFLLVFLAHWALRRHLLADRWLLLGASFVFYAHWSFELCFLLLALGLWAWGAGRLVAPGAHARPPWRLPLAVAGPLLVLGWFKYADFFLAEAGALLARFGLEAPPLLGIILPVGISFFCFQAISYILDVARGEARAEPSPLFVLVYIFFFPHLAAGPIVRAAHFLPQVAAPSDPRRIPFLMAGLLILGGLCKKLLLANTLATQLVDPVFRDPEGAAAADALLAIYGYAAQIWCDFSAYSDMAIGVAALLGFHFPRNFDQPYRAASLSEFWRRWHISLSSWLRDYLYIPLGGSRGGEARTARNLMLTMVLGGLWHGAAWRFVLWGALHGAGLVAERFLGLRGAVAGPRRWLGMLLTFHLVCLGWVLFRAPDMEGVGGILTALGRWEPALVATPLLAALTAFALALHLLPGDWVERLERRLVALPAPTLGVGFGVAILLIVTLGPSGVAPFIYFQF
ncbi:MBOAT family protein [Siccirubricoccus sp. KC 17139]|uniref:Probable alginate O-acetylase AlgI n=1 Tax=Siccirubricoccus soli TaxID=2899147 RepID=A0ABT1DCC3_9PROT|nr:MBOAT family O-acyltransferase [Siccirubricoccus soli]MCO6418829.1 MBOAT family protein [Siccirubricoccus soli]MCP2684964.1 MBOAT family protein [Siccirubricoccus soli]